MNPKLQNTFFFFVCKHVMKSLHDLLIVKASSIEPLSSHAVLYGYISRDKKIGYLVKNIIILTFYLHKCRYGKSVPSCFKQEVQLLKLSLDKNVMNPSCQLLM